jgi:hypothetical protein
LELGVAYPLLLLQISFVAQTQFILVPSLHFVFFENPKDLLSLLSFSDFLQNERLSTGGYPGEKVSNYILEY